MSCTDCKQCSAVKKSAKKLLKWPKYRYYSDRLLEILKNFEKENIFFSKESILKNNFQCIKSHCF